MRVTEVMTKEVQTIRPQARVADAREQMRRHGIHHLVVMDSSKIVGVISDRDAGGRKGAGVRAESRVEDLMTRTVVTVAPDETIRKVANLMRGRTIGCVAVTARGRLKGIVTVSDLLTILGGGADRPATPARHTLNYRSPHRKHHRAYGAW